MKYIFKLIAGREILNWGLMKLPVKWFGNVNAGFYVADDKFSDKTIIYSFGIGEDVSFDEALIESFGCTVYAFDPTPKTKEFLSKKGTSNRFLFFDYGLYNLNGFIEFYLPPNPDHVSGTTYNRWVDKDAEIRPIQVPVKSFSSIVKDLRHDQIDILKMDIEGSEYVVLDDILSSGVEIKQILIEFHHRFRGVGIKRTKEAIKKLKDSGYKIAAISNSKEEYTFVKSSYFSRREYA
jgi:FkbM family methyltransferase